MQTGANPDSEKTIAARVALTAMGMDKQTYREYVDQKGRLRATYVRPEYIWARPRWALGVRQVGFNVKAVDAAGDAAEAAGLPVDPAASP